MKGNISLFPIKDLKTDNKWLRNLYIWLLGLLLPPVNPTSLYPLLFLLSKQIEIHLYNLIVMTLGNKMRSLKWIEE
jgi:hypothetical protein